MAKKNRSAHPLGEENALSVVERTKAGLDAARRRGVQLGRPLSLNKEQITHARKAIEQGETVSGMASVLGVSRNTLSLALNRSRGNQSK